MKRFFLTLFALVLSVGLTLPDAEAKRLGSGKSFGTQRDATTQAPAAPMARSADTAPNAAAAAGQAAKKNSWMGPLAGLAAGLGLAALASHLGMGEGLANILMIALLAMAAFAVFRLVMRKRSTAPAMQYAGAGAGGGTVAMPAQASGAPAVAAAAHSGAGMLPAGFDAEAFVRQAKLNFVRLQAANDARNLDDLREFVAPEMFAELQMQIQERGDAVQRTEVVDLHAEVVGYAEEAQRHLVSVRFHGLIREETGAAPVEFDERWHLAKALDGSRGWVVAGIQQSH
ncbi:Tim44 domain-containing protein [Aromatoleum bremense]|uniref:Tim44 domain-containing protein n=1 Tax=Aromatoleum bremense TaxID=76115 RepID=A0ABX1NYF9_9RHOO|nr:TIM44-like domain-containing protein [Aromatoleum bremense]NMG16606.1 Tim44 domain-containing protein [Aromatoleum bremense]QTQ31426.1 Tim44-like domain-containing protein [Aromatoleum bremense]